MYKSTAKVSNFSLKNCQKFKYSSGEKEYRIYLYTIKSYNASKNLLLAKKLLIFFFKVVNLC